ncbi:MAG: hypothetical protein NZ891_02425, partial [bacterium]|nr:hypothetical protein [bacterium]MDW8163580.1 hypothetical protein [Candidatus Omnitrophota bacterium]
LYTELKTTGRHLLSELLRREHLKFLKDIKIEVFDPSADRYLNGEILVKNCPCKFTLRIQSWEIFNLKEDELEKLYIKLASYKPISISFSLERLIYQK